MIMGGETKEKILLKKKIRLFRLMRPRGSPAQLTEQIHMKSYTLEISKHQGT